MKNRQTSTTLLAGLFIAAIAAVLIFAYKKDKMPSKENSLEDGSEENHIDLSEIKTSFSEKFLDKLDEAENKLKAKDTHFSLPAGDFGLFL